MPEIRQLSASVVNKIAAGEVIERPASVVKELMENSVDAGAARIDVAVEQGGLELIRVCDDGHGIAPDELPLAVASHATSKIREADDLFRVGTLGFRGEALASIAEVSRFLIRSRQPSSPAAVELEVIGGERRDPAPCGCGPGTVIEVRQLFFNTPVRRKFLRSTQTEMGYIAEAFTRLALAHPQVHCTLKHNERTIHDLPPTDDWRTRIAAFFGEDLARDLIGVSSFDGEIKLSGYVAAPSHSRANVRMQYLFLNGRSIRDRSLHHALSEAYRGLLLTGRYPIAMLRIEMPPELIDVNVHPTKLEVRFQDSGRLYSQLLGTLRTKFLSTDLTARLQPGVSIEQELQAGESRIAQVRQELVGWVKGELQRSATVNAFSPVTSRQAPAAEPVLQFGALSDRGGGLDLIRLDQSWRQVGSMIEDDPEPEFEMPAALDASAPAANHRTDGVATASSGPHGSSWGGSNGPASALQVHNRYLIAETEEGLLVVDQHALHERILYEQLREKVLAGALESQRLLVPEPVDLTPAERAAVLDARDALATLGVAVEAFGGDTVIISSYPAMLANFSPAQVLRDLVDLLLSGGKAPERRDLVDELLHMISCKAAIKAGDRLTPEEVSALLEQRHLAQDTHHCPHGRPTALVFTREELDKQFKRI